MTPHEELVGLANDYISRRRELPSVANWMNKRLEYFAELPEDEDASKLWGFLQVRVYEIDDGFMTEEELRSELPVFLADHGWLGSTPGRRAAG